MGEAVAQRIDPVSGPKLPTPVNKDMVEAHVAPDGRLHSGHVLLCSRCTGEPPLVLATEREMMLVNAIIDVFYTPKDTVAARWQYMSEDYRKLLETLGFENVADSSL